MPVLLHISGSMDVLEAVRPSMFADITVITVEGPGCLHETSPWFVV